MLTVTREPALESAAELEPVAVLVDALAPRLAEELSSRIPGTATPDPAATARLLTLDELVAELPLAKPPQTWKRWLYERTRRGEIPPGTPRTCASGSRRRRSQRPSRTFHEGSTHRA
jgi:hypothetical protein